MTFIRRAKEQRDDFYVTRTLM
jgi:fermentation-respiration switch protein FrsA (DUF1100 family)